jgi:hypothetical protein
VPESQLAHHQRPQAGRPLSAFSLDPPITPDRKDLTERSRPIELVPTSVPTKAIVRRGWIRSIRTRGSPPLRSSDSETAG